MYFVYLCVTDSITYSKMISYACCYNFVGNHSVEESFDYYTSVSFPNFDIVPAYTTHYTLKIDIVADRILEDNELFQVTALPQHRSAGQPDCSVSVIIADDDGKFNTTVINTV